MFFITKTVLAFPTVVKPNTGTKAAVTKECLNSVCWMMMEKFIFMAIRQAVMTRPHLSRLIVMARHTGVR